MKLEELRKRYEALGKIEELPFERTALGRCSTFERFIEYGPIIAEQLDMHRRLHADHPTPVASNLFDLIEEVWVNGDGVEDVGNDPR